MSTTTTTVQRDDIKILDLLEPGTNVQHLETIPARSPVPTPMLEAEAKVPPVASPVEEKPPAEDEPWYIGSIDQGTTSSRFLIFDAQGNPVASHQIEFENLYPHSG